MSLALCLAPVVLASCSTGSPRVPGGADAPLRVVAAENFWGSIAAQLGGAHVLVASIIDSPDADPHDYEPTTADGRAVASADLVLVNGVGYDTWATKLVDANPDPSRAVVDVGRLVGVAAGGNPHRWYDPADVQQVVDRLTDEYQRLDPSHAAYYAERRVAFDTTATRAYKTVLAEILEERAVSSRGRQIPRGVKRKMSNFPLRPRNVSATRPVRYADYIKVLK